MLRRLLSTTSAPAAPKPTSPAIVTEPNFFADYFGIDVPGIAKQLPSPRLSMETSDLTNISEVVATPKEYLKKTAYIRRMHGDTTQTMHRKPVSKYWRIELGKEPTWKNALMGWNSAGDALGYSGLPLIKFTSADSALAFVTKNGWKGVIEKANPLASFTDKKNYANNFLPVHVKSFISKHPPGHTMKVHYSHPERGSSCWVNLGQMAVQNGTSTHSNKKVENVSQDFWNSPEVDKHSATWRYDNNEQKISQLVRKIR